MAEADAAAIGKFPISKRLIVTMGNTVFIRQRRAGCDAAWNHGLSDSLRANARGNINQVNQEKP
jgi:hypothetical protein